MGGRFSGPIFGTLRLIVVGDQFNMIRLMEAKDFPLPLGPVGQLQQSAPVSPAPLIKYHLLL